MFKNNPNVFIPTIYPDYTKERVLVMSFEIGIPCTHVKDMVTQGIDLKRLSKIISESFIHMIYQKGFVHSDPHPGNLFVRKKVMPNGSEDIELVILDHGLYTTLND
jgi:aarF domain-containing kinase